ncbi:MAG: hypothetical protein DLM69_02580 [Candidatus Chloroheliales bacterium]|nr:MAG: hypothetical protein DLM69_02580 [Chloroflexota bacterium]
MNEEERDLYRRNLEHAKQMRSNPSSAEATLWYHLRAARSGYKFRRQQRIGAYIVDFYCPRCWLIIELDGDSHAEQVEYDAARTDWLQLEGYKVVRFTNAEVRYQLSAVLETIQQECQAREGIRFNTPSP